MRATLCPLETSPLSPQRVRTSAIVDYDSVTPSRERYWIDIPQEYAAELRPSGDPWLCCLLPVAMRLREPLWIEAEVDPRLRLNADALQRIWSSWFPDLVRIDLHAPASLPSHKDPSDAAAFFSGGLDSTFTAARHAGQRGEHPLLAALLLVHGFDIPLRQAERFSQVEQRVLAAGQELGVPVRSFVTNLRDTQLGRLSWGAQAHGSALGAIACSIQGAHSTLLIASSSSCGDLGPWGSHPVLDPFFSTSYSRVVHDGVEFSRSEKAEWLVENDLAQQTLRVCWQSDTEHNCCRCAKCFHTLAILDILDRLPDYPAFTRPFAPSDLHCLYLWSDDARRFFDDVLRLAQQRGRHDYIRGIEQMLDASLRKDRQLALVDGLKQFPILRRCWQPLRSRLLRRSIIAYA